MSDSPHGGGDSTSTPLWPVPRFSGPTDPLASRGLPRASGALCAFPPAWNLLRVLMPCIPARVPRTPRAPRDPASRPALHPTSCAHDPPESATSLRPNFLRPSSRRPWPRVRPPPRTRLPAPRIGPPAGPPPALRCPHRPPRSLPACSLGILVSPRSPRHTRLSPAGSRRGVASWAEVPGAPAAGTGRDHGSPGQWRRRQGPQWRR